MMLIRGSFYEEVEVFRQSNTVYIEEKLKAEIGRECTHCRLAAEINSDQQTLGLWSVFYVSA